MPKSTLPVYPGVWVTRTKPHLCYRVLPKCGCSSVGQIFHFLDHGSFYPGDIHEPAAPILKWKSGENEVVREICSANHPFRFTLVRNPYRRLVSSFTDKVFGFQPNGKRYRSGQIVDALKGYDVHWGANANIVTNFRRFVRFVADTLERGEPMEADMHWIPTFDQLKFTLKNAPDWSLDFIGQIEHFQRDINTAMQQAGIATDRIPQTIPRENTTSLPPIAIQNFYGPEEIEIMTHIYGRDFDVFRYSHDPTEAHPMEPADVANVNAALHGLPSSVAAPANLKPEPAEELIELNGVKIPVNTECFSTKMLRVMMSGEYELDEALHIPKMIKPGERIVELGAGVGYISSLCAKTTKAESITVYEAHPELIPVIERTHELNGVKARVVNAVVLPKADHPTVPFYIREDFWASSLHSEPYGYARVVNVPVVSMAQVLADHRPTMLIVDIEGGEGLLFNDVALTGVKKIYLEVHPDVLGVTAVKKLFEFFASRRFRYDQWRSSNNGVLFTRVQGQVLNPQVFWNRYLRRWLKRVTPPIARKAAKRLIGIEPKNQPRRTAAGATKATVS